MRSLLLVGMLALAGCASRPSTSTTTVTSAPQAWEPRSIARYVKDQQPDPCVPENALLVGFAENSAELSPDDVLPLERLATCAAARGSTVELVGSEDPTEALQAGHDLARRRADAVQEVLANGGVQPGKLSILSAGERHVSPARSATARSVEVVLDRTK
jgi:outer membrane protein OmpA-like peptidoglycan-associated protein